MSKPSKKNGRELDKEPLTFHRKKIQQLLELIAGGNNQLTREQLNDWRDLIMFLVDHTRAECEHPDTEPGLRSYYSPHWKMIEHAEDDPNLIVALESLRLMIRCE